MPTTDAVREPFPDHAAFDRTADLRSAIPDGRAPHYTLDAFHAAGRALSISPRVMPFRDQMLAIASVLSIGSFDVAHFDRFEDLARGLRFVQTEISRKLDRPRNLPALAAEGWRMRALFLRYAEVLSYKGEVAPALLVRQRRGSGYRDLVEDLEVLVQELGELPAGRIGPDAPVTGADLDRAAWIANQVITRVGTPADVDVDRRTLLIERKKQGGLLLAAHDGIRRAVTFLRWKEGDAAKLVPPLYVTGRRRKPAAPEVPPPDTPPSAAAEPPDR